MMIIEITTLLSTYKYQSRIDLLQSIHRTCCKCLLQMFTFTFEDSLFFCNTYSMKVFHWEIWRRWKDTRILRKMNTPFGHKKTVFEKNNSIKEIYRTINTPKAAFVCIEYYCINLADISCPSLTLRYRARYLKSQWIRIQHVTWLRK